MKRLKRILAAVTAAAMTLLIAPELGGEVFSRVGGLVQDFAVSVSAEEGEVVPVPIELEPVQSKTDTDSFVTDDMTASDGISAQSDVTIVDSGYCGYSDLSTSYSDNVVWKLTTDETITISGTGEIYRFNSTEAPWYKYKDSVKKVIVSNGITSLGSYAFQDFHVLEDVILPEGLSGIGYGSFNACGNIKEIELPSSIEYFEKYAFAGCVNLKTINWNENIVDIDSYAFSNCVSLNNIYLSENVNIYDNAFIDCDSIDHIHISTTKTCSDYAGKGGLPNESSCYFPDGCIKSGCPYNNGSSADTSVKSGKCGDNAYWELNSDGILNISGTGEMYNYSDVGVIPWGTNVVSVEINQGITYIGDNAFNHCLNLASITIPNSVIRIGNRAFYYCTNLTDIVIPYNVTKIGIESFNGCANLTDIIIPNSVNNIGDWAFANCTSLKTITIPNSITSIGKNSFLNCFNLTSIIFSNSSTSISDRAFYKCYKLKHIHIPSNKSYSDYAGQGDLPTEPSYYFPGGCGDPNCPLYVNGEIPDKPVNPDNPDDPKDPNEPVDEETAKDYDFSVSVHLTNSKDEIVYNVDEKTYNKNEYELGAYFDSSKGGKSINGLKVLYSISGGFAFSADGAKTEISSEIKSSFLTDTWEFASEPFKVYPISNVDISEQGYFSVRVSVYAGDKLIKKVREDVPIKVKKTPDDAPDNINGIKITSENIDDFLDQNGDLIITDGEYAISGKVSCNNLYVKGGQLRVGGILDVKGNAEITGGKTNWFNPISQDVCGGVLTVYGTLNVKGNMTVGTDSGILEMTNSKAVVDVAGDFKITANSTMYRSKLTAGVLKIGGSFESSGKDSGNFKALGDHITHFYSNDSFSVKMNTKDKDDDKNSYFNNLTFTDSAVNNYSGELYTFNVKGYFRQNDTQNPNYVKGELLDRLFKDHTTFGEAEEAVIGRFASLSGSTSLLKTSINAGTNKKIPKEYIDMICAYSEMYFQMEVMNNENDKNFSIEGAEIKIHGFEKEITFYNIPFGDSTAEVTIHFNVMGGGYSSSTADLCEAKWLVFYDNDSGYLSGMAPMTYISTDSLASDLRKFAQEEGHFGDFWYWMTEFVNGFISDYGSFTKADVRGVKCQMAFLDKCYKSLKSHSISPFKYNIKSGSDALKKAKKFADVVNKGNTWISAFLCPVDVEIRDSENNVVGSIVDNKVIVSTNKVTMKAIGDKKYCTFNEYDNYFITLTATGTGTMDYIIDELNDISTYRRISFNDIPLNLGTVYTGNFECINMLPDENYKLTDNLGNVYTSDFDEVDLNGNIKSLITEADQPSQPTPSIPSVPSNPSTDNSGNQGGSTINSTAPASTSFNVKLENKITGKTGKAKATRTDKNITINVGRENNGYYANIYNTNGNLIDSVKIKNGKAKFTISSDIDFYIVIDQDSHLEYEDVSSGAGIYELFEEKKEPFCMIIIVITALGFLSVAIAKRYQKNKR